ncbi:MAG: hypothetical protein HZB71_01855 [Betaproteobacteria bacterium]|nr:hypothetical protein [Betaproteobacteria bacterium]
MTVAPQARIRRLRLQAPAGLETAARMELEQADWDITRQDEVVFLRRLHVRARPGEIGAEAVRQARALAAGAVDGWSPAADAAEAVRFARPAERMACLLGDLAQGRAQARWFWQGGQRLAARTLGVALLALLQELPLAWPAAAARLARETPVWRRFWQTLTDPEAAQALALLEAATGWPLVPGAPEATARSDAMPVASPGARRSPLPAGLAEAVAVLPAPLAPASPRLRLAVVTALWRHAPQTLAAAHELERCVLGAHALILAGATAPDAAGNALHESIPSFPQTREPSAVNNLDSGFRRNDESLLAGSPLHVPSGVPSVPCLAACGKEVTGEASPQPVQESGPVAVPAEETRFITALGGWFLLLNVLARAAPEAPCSGWHALYRLGRVLELEPDPPLARFFAQALDRAAPEALADLAPLPQEPDWRTLLHGGPGAEIAAIPALVVATASHVDVFFRMQDARLEIRLAGLDVNPGWLPWLGRVVSYHYGVVPELAFFVAPASLPALSGSPEGAGKDAGATGCFHINE